VGARANLGPRTSRNSEVSDTADVDQIEVTWTENGGAAEYGSVEPFINIAQYLLYDHARGACDSAAV
jgi:hypothetical protein